MAEDGDDALDGEAQLLIGGAQPDGANLDMVAHV